MWNKKVKNTPSQLRWLLSAALKGFLFETVDNGTVLFNGFLGKLERVSMVDDLMLQIEIAN